MPPKEGSVPSLKEQTWQDILTRVEGLIGKQSVEIWLKNTILVRLDEQDCEVGVPNQYVQEWIRHRLAQPLQDGIHAVTGWRPNLSVTINGHLFRKMRELQMQEPEPAPRPPRRRPTGAQQIFRLNPKYTLDTFVAGPDNELAYNAACHVAAEPGRLYNPLFIYGGCGLGKTHLLQGIAQALLARHRDLEVLYLTSEYFTNQFVNSLQEKTVDAFRERVRGVDVLIIDDVHGLARRAATQEEFLQTFNELQGANKQVVLASDAHPRHVEKLKVEIVSRCISGMVAPIEAPTLETRVQVIRAKLAQHRQTLPDEVIAYLARKVTRSIRELEGALVRLVAVNALLNERISLPLARRALSDFTEGGDRLLTLTDVENVVISQLNVTSAQLHSKNRRKGIVLPRQFCMYLACRLTDYSLNEIGDFFDKNHATVLYAKRKITKMMAEDEEIRRTVRRLLKDLQSDA